MKPTLWLWRIKTIRWQGKEGKECEEFIAAPSIRDVWQYLTTDLSDASVEVEAISREVPILHVIEAARI